MRRGRGRVIMIAAIAAFALAAGAPMAGASLHSTTPGWRIVKVYPKCDEGAVDAITATRPSDAWATVGFGQDCIASPLLIARWDGHSWKGLLPPDQFADSEGTAVAALSRSYAWTFMDRNNVGSALQWNDGHWRSFLMPGRTVIQSAAVFSRSDAWAFAGGFAARFNGRSWRQVSIPVSPVSTATVGPRSIWAVGPLPSATVSTFALGHWTGRWRTIVIPMPNPVQDQPIYAWVVPDKSDGAWVLTWNYTLTRLLHWTGSRWHQVRFPFTSEGNSIPLGPMARDGNGGVWVATYPEPYHGCGCQELAMVHYSSAGTWSRKFVPAEAGISSMRLIPGTTSVWAAGFAGSFPTIFKYGP